MIPVVLAELQASLAAREAGVKTQAKAGDPTHPTRTPATTPTGWRADGAGLHTAADDLTNVPLERGHARMGGGALWEQLPLLVNGIPQPLPCSGEFQKTCLALQAIPELQLRNGQAKISMLQPGTRIRPHCGPTNERLRMHCALIVPSPMIKKDQKGSSPKSKTHSSSSSDDGDGAGEIKNGHALFGDGNGDNIAWMRVGTDTTTWKEGECFVFNESCEHEVWLSTDAGSARAVLILDFVNPFLSHDSDFLAAFATPRAAEEAVLARNLREQRRSSSTARGHHAKGSDEL